MRRTLTEVRAALGPEADRLIAPAASPRTLQIDLKSDGAYCDIVAFDVALARGREDALRAAVQLYASAGGALLEGERGEWIYPEREARAQAYLAAREHLALQLRERHDLPGAIEQLQAVLLVEPTRETAVRGLMRLLQEEGQSAAALAAYRSLHARLQKEADALPDAETTALYKRMYQTVRLGAGNAAQSIAKALPGGEEPAPVFPRHNLPHPVTSLIGRERDCVEVIAHLRADKDKPPARFLTLLGAGGVGKTRLSLAVAATVSAGYEDGACFVDFAPVSTSAQISSPTSSPWPRRRLRTCGVRSRSCG